MQSYRDLTVWQRSIDLTDGIYEVTSSFPREERFGLTQQLQRAAVSIASNIAEGRGRTNRDFVRYLLQARGSLHELETQLIIAARRRYLPAEHAAAFEETTAECGRLLNGLIRAIRARSDDRRLPTSD